MERFSNDEDVSEYFTRDILDRTRENFAKKDGAKEKSIEIAKKMLTEIDNLEFISRMTDLPIEEIKALKNENETIENE